MELYQLIVWRDGDHFHGKKADSVGNIVLVKFPVGKVMYVLLRLSFRLRHGNKVVSWYLSQINFTIYWCNGYKREGRLGLARVSWIDIWI